MVLDNASDGEAEVKWDDWDWDLVNENVGESCLILHHTDVVGALLCFL